MYTIEPIREEHKEFEVKELFESDYDRLKNNFEVLLACWTWFKLR